MEIKSTEFFRNIKKLPPKGSREYEQLKKWELEKCLGGLNIAGIHIPGWLYWHVNHWHIFVDKKDNYGNIVREVFKPDLRDNEWMRAEYIEQCKNYPGGARGYCEVGGRQQGKSEFEASYLGYNTVMFKGTQNIVVSSNKADLNLIIEKLKVGLDPKYIWGPFNRGQIDKNWKNKSEIKLGYKDKDNVDHIWSWIMFRVTADGLNTEAPAGTTAKSFVMDEIGKAPFIQVFEAAKPAFLSEFGWRVIPILVGTGGSFENGQDAENVFYSPDENNLLAVEDEFGKRTCVFMPGTYRQDAKYLTTLFDYLKNVRKFDVKEGQGLEDIVIKVSDVEKAKKIILEEREQKKKNQDRKVPLKHIMYYPLKPEECFLTDTNNNFPVEALQAQKEFLFNNKITGQRVRLYRDRDGKVKHRFAKDYDLPVNEFPVKKDTNKDAPIVIYEFPMDNPPYGMYVAGSDPYNQSTSYYSTSLGTMYIFKRRVNVIDETYQDQIVASLAARPDRIEEWHETAEMLLEYYSATCLPEMEELLFLKHMDSKNKGYMLYDGSPVQKIIAPESRAERPKGLPATTAIQKYYIALAVKYCKEEFIQNYDLNGNPIKYTGVRKILDPMLIEEMIKYKQKESGGHDGNFDRIVAFGHALVLARHLDSQNHIVDIKPVQKVEQQRIITSPFMAVGNPFNKSSSPFSKRLH